MTEDVEKRIAHFVDDVVMPCANPLPNVPPNLQGDWKSGDGWTSWIAVPSSVNNDDLNAVEHQFRVRLPPLFRAYFLYKQVLDGDFGIVRLPNMTPPDLLGDLRRQMAIASELPALRENSLLPFGRDGNDGGPICFKTDEPNAQGDFPIYFADHELLADSAYRGERRWDSFEHLIDDIQTDILSRK